MKDPATRCICRHGAGWVCEDHPEKAHPIIVGTHSLSSSVRENICTCGAPGMPCPKCYRTRKSPAAMARLTQDLRARLTQELRERVEERMVALEERMLR